MIPYLYSAAAVQEVTLKETQKLLEQERKEVAHFKV